MLKQDLYELFLNETDETLRQNYRNELFMGYIPTIDSYIKKYEDKIVDVDDFRQELYITLMEYIDRGLSAGNQHISTMVANCINRKCLDLIDKASKGRNQMCVSDIETVLFESVADDFYIDDDCAGNVELKDFQETMDKCLGVLTERERKCVRMYYGFDGDEYTFEDIGKVFNVSKTRPSQIVAKSLRKIRRRARNLGLYDYIEELA